VKSDAPATIDEYIAGFPEDVQKILQKLRSTINAAAPDAKEVISYQMPAFRQGGVLVYFGGFKDHVSFFPTGSGVAAFVNELGPYEHSKGTIQFPLDKPVPFDLVTRIVRFRVEEERKKSEAKRSKKERPV